MTEEVQPSEDSKPEKQPRRNDKWICPKCGMTIVLHIRVSEPPTCGNTKSHSGRVEMEKKTK